MLGFVIIKWFRNIHKAGRSLQTGYRFRLKCRSGRLNLLSSLLTKHNPQGSTNNLFLPSSVSIPNKILWLFALTADKNGCWTFLKIYFSTSQRFCKVPLRLPVVLLFSSKQNQKMFRCGLCFPITNNYLSFTILWYLLKNKKLQTAKTICSSNITFYIIISNFGSKYLVAGRTYCIVTRTQTTPFNIVDLVKSDWLIFYNFIFKITKMQ